jgi:hypothetical protein
MKKLLLGTIFLSLALAVPVPSMAEVSINIGIPLPPLPPPIIFPAPPAVIPLPDTDDVYVDPDINADIYFWNGYWWRLWDGRWYRSPYYDRGWYFYDAVPTFYFDVDPGWRGFYRDRVWYGHPWRYNRIPYRTFHQNWRRWHSDRRWRHDSWGVRGYRPAPRRQRQELRRQRQRQFEGRPEVQRNMRERRGQGARPEARPPRGGHGGPGPQGRQPERGRQVQPRGQERGGGPQHPQGRPEGGQGRERGQGGERGHGGGNGQERGHGQDGGHGDRENR